jgi:hypothetical protein
MGLATISVFTSYEQGSSRLFNAPRIPYRWLAQSHLGERRAHAERALAALP